MLALQVEIDGEPAVVAGVADWSVLALHITGSRGDPSAPVESARADDVRYSVGGLTQPNSEGVCHHFRWGDKHLAVGSKVVVIVVDVKTPDAPIKRYRSDAQVQEPPFTEEEARELRYQDYLQFKKEFEGTPE